MELDPRRARSFGPTAEEYERFRPGYPDEAVDWLLPPGARQVADLGAGTGKLTRPLLARGLQVTAIEPDPAMLAVLTRLHPAATAVQAGAAQLPLPDASVDAVVAGQAWHWFPPAEAVAEVRRVLRPGGRLGLVWNSEDPHEPWEHELWRIDPDNQYAGREPDLTVPGLEDEPTERATFRWSEQATAADLRARWATRSIFILMEPDERDRTLDAMAGIAAAEAARRDSDTVPLHQDAYCVRWTPPG